MDHAKSASGSNPGRPLDGRVETRIGEAGPRPVLTCWTPSKDGCTITAGTRAKRLAGRRQPSDRPWMRHESSGTR